MTKTTKKRAPYRETKRLKAHERNEIILEAAKRILIDEGYAAFSLRYAAEKSGIRLATLQYYYKTKQDLFRAAFEDALAAEAQRVNKLIVRAGASPDSILRAHIKGHYKANLNQETVGFFFQLWARANLDEFAAELMDEFYEPVIDTLVELITNYNTILPQSEARRRAVFTVSSLEGMIILAGTEKRKRKKNGLTEKFYVDTLMDFLKQPPTKG